MSDVPDAPQPAPDGTAATPTYFYRLGVALAPDQHFVLPDGTGHDECFHIAIPNRGDWEICAEPPGTPMQDAREVVVIERGFRSAEDAQRRGTAVMDFMRFGCLKWLLGMDFGSTAGDFFMFDDGQQFRLEVVPHPGQAPSLLGVMVYEGNPGPTFTPRPAGVSRAPYELARLFHNVAELVEPPTEFSDRQRVACELLHAARFERATRPRFLLVVAAMEALLKQERRGPTAQKILDEALTLVANADPTAISNAERQTLTDTLGYARRESIAETGAKLAESLMGNNTYNGVSPRQFFKQVYAVRSNLLHNGQVRPDLAKIVPGAGFPDHLETTFELFVQRTEWFARELLYWHVFRT